MSGLQSKLWMVAVAALAFPGFMAGAQTSPVYENRGSVSNPMVDATTFLNRGLFDVSSFDQPYDTQNTRNYTNFAGATISGSGGFRFEFVDGGTGTRGDASNFANLGSIAFTGGGGFGGFSSGSGSLFSSYSSSWIVVNASNILNRGGLSVDSEGLIKLSGSNVSIARSGLRAGEDPFVPIREGNVFGDQYSNDAGVTDLYWGVGQNNVLDPAGPGPFNLAVLTGAQASSGAHEVLVRSGRTNRVSVSAPTGFALTNQVSPTNLVVQVVFVNTNSTDPQFKVDVKWGEPRIGDLPGAKMPIVRFTFEDIDTITTEPYTNYVYLLDSLGALTNGVLITNINRVDQRPHNYVVTRVTPDEWETAGPTNAIYTPDLIVNPNLAAAQVTNSYAAYRAQIGTSTTTTPSFGGGGFFGGSIPELTHPTNLPGRVEIDADRLDLSLTRFRTDGLLSVTAKELVGSAPYKLDSEAVSVNVGNPGSSLVVSNLIQPIVRRFNGVVTAWSGIWTNQTFVTGPDPNDPALQVTNTVDIRYHVLIVGHQFITRVPVQTYKFIAQAPHVVLRDAVSVVEDLQIDSPSVDVRAQLSTQSNPITESSFPSLVNLTNRSSISTPAGLTLGSASRPVAQIVNGGVISGSILQITAGELVNGGEMESTVGDAVIQAQNVKFETAGTLSSPANVWITADDLKAEGSQINAGYEARNQTSGNTNYFPGAIILNVATRLADTGVTASNVWTVYDGVQMASKPAQGDLLGTRLVSKVNRFAEAVHIWAGEDRGATAAGYVDNSALGTLVLDGRTFSLFTFRSGSTNPAALYVDSLVLTNYAADPTAALNIEPGFTLYFAECNLPADSLDGAFDGRLRWVKDYAGALSSVPVRLSSGRQVLMNRSLVASSVIDSDGDGVANSLDSAPFEPAAIRVNVRMLSGTTPARAQISWAGTPGNRYRVEYSNRLDGSGWQTLTEYDPQNSAADVMSVTDTVTGTDEEPRFYRVVEIR